MSIVKMIQQFSSELATFVKKGAPIVTEGVYQKRIGICNACEYIKRPNFSCGKCGCNMTIKAKWGTSMCPINKWPAETKKK